jgi:hypothetical protein
MFPQELVAKVAFPDHGILLTDLYFWIPHTNDDQDNEQQVYFTYKLWMEKSLSYMHEP